MPEMDDYWFNHMSHRTHLPLPQMVQEGTPIEEAMEEVIGCGTTCMSRMAGMAGICWHSKKGLRCEMPMLGCLKAQWQLQLHPTR